MIERAASIDSVQRAVFRYNRELGRNSNLSKRMSLVRSWYAIRDDGNWKFAPSKFIGYEGLDADTYLNRARNYLDGRVTEAHLRQWFKVVDPTDKLYDRLNSDLTAFLLIFNKTPNKRSRINVLV